jgi:hypothetical protein
MLLIIIFIGYYKFVQHNVAHIGYQSSDNSVLFYQSTIHKVKNHYVENTNYEDKLELNYFYLVTDNFKDHSLKFYKYQVESQT